MNICQGCGSKVTDTEIIQADSHIRTITKQSRFTGKVICEHTEICGPVTPVDPIRHEALRNKTEPDNKYNPQKRR